MHSLSISNHSRRLTSRSLHETAVQTIEKEDIQQSLLSSTSIMKDVLADRAKENEYVQAKATQCDSGKEQELLIVRNTSLSPALRALKVHFLHKRMNHDSFFYNNLF